MGNEERSVAWISARLGTSIKNEAMLILMLNDWETAG